MKTVKEQPCMLSCRHGCTQCKACSQRNEWAHPDSELNKWNGQLATLFCKPKKSPFAVSTCVFCFSSNSVFFTLFVFNPIFSPILYSSLIFLTITFLLSTLRSSFLQWFGWRDKCRKGRHGENALGPSVWKKTHSGNWPLYTFPHHLNHIKIAACDRNWCFWTAIVTQILTAWLGKTVRELFRARRLTVK